jgi:hypothetical protein
MECILVDDAQTDGSEKEMVSMYLNLRYNAFQVVADPERVASIEELPVVDKKNIGQFKHLAGSNFRIWRYGELVIDSENAGKEQVVFQSYMSIDKNFKAVIKVPKHPAEDGKLRTENLDCRILFNKLHTLRMLVMVYRHETLTTFTISNLPGVIGQVIQGIYCMETRNTPNKPPLAGCFLLVKEDSPCEAKIIPINKIDQEVGDSKHLIKMKDALKSCPSFDPPPPADSNSK